MANLTTKLNTDDNALFSVYKIKCRQNCLKFFLFWNILISVFGFTGGFPVFGFPVIDIKNHWDLQINEKPYLNESKM